MQEFRRKEGTVVTAVRLDLDTEGFTYQKWGDRQQCKQGDWVLDSGSDVYTVDAETFARTYRLLSAGQYEKIGNVWAEEATESGTIQTKEGSTAYARGDYLVFNNPDRNDGYAMSAEKFRELYQPK